MTDEKYDTDDMGMDKADETYDMADNDVADKMDVTDEANATYETDNTNDTEETGELKI